MNLSNNIKKQSDWYLTVFIVLGILIMLNYFSYQMFYRWDITQNGDYSLSDSSKQTASEVDDIVQIKLYFSQELPPQYINLKQEVSDILDEYASHAKNKITYEYIDPKVDQSTQQQVAMMGIPQLQFNVLEKDKYQVVNGYLGMVIQYGDKREVIPMVLDTTDLEYRVTLGLKKVTNQNMPAVGLVTSHGCASPKKDLATVYKKLSELYEVTEIDLSASKNISADLQTLLIIGPTQKFSEEELKRIDAFLLAENSLMILADGVNYEEGLSASINDVGLQSLLTTYGIKYNHDLVMDFASNEMASFTQGYMSYATNYPFWPKIRSDGFDKNNLAVAKLESLALPWVSSLSSSLTSSYERQISYLAKTSAKSAIQSENFNLNPQNIALPESFNQYAVAVQIVGKFKSAYGDQMTDNARLVVVGDSDFIRDGFLRKTSDNLIFFQNLVDGLTLDQNLISIRSKGISERPLKELPDSIKMVLRYFNVFLVTLLFVLFGVVRYWLRRRVKFADDIN